ncbi:MAG TPA: ABC transporter ATP-binding protein [Halococcus sp.]|nr:ABC transporter ATP-binding protein [Halococcus sp.]
MSVINFDEVSVQYKTQSGDEWALDDVTVAIERGESIGITGPSEAGKATFLRVIASYIPNYFTCELRGNATVNEISVAETTIGEMSETVAMLFENPFDQLTGATSTVVEEVAYGLENQGIERDEIINKTHESIETVGITDLMNRDPYDLSGGQSQRVSLASILALEPEVLLLYEPTSQLDPSGTADVYDVIAEMESDEYTTIVVSQNTERLAPIVDRLLVFDDGRIRADDDPQSVLTSEIADEDLFFVPDIVRVGTRLRETGRVAAGRPVPLHRNDVLAELRTVTSPSTENISNQIDCSDTVSPTDEIIEFENVRFSYGEDIEALSDISLSIGEGCTCLVGQNGAGKSTVAKHLNGLLKPDEGTVSIKGRDTHDWRVAQLARDVGLSFQNPDNQLFHSSVKEEVRYGPRNLDYDEDTVDTLSEKAIGLMELKDVRNKNPYDLELARRKRIAVASVLAMDTDIVVLDEPTGGQDVRGTKLLGNAVETLVDDGKAVVVITHDMTFTRDYADRIVALRQGEVLLDNHPRTVFGQEETLAETAVRPPEVTQLGAALGLPETVLTVDELFEILV